LERIAFIPLVSTSFRHFWGRFRGRCHQASSIFFYKSTSLSPCSLMPFTLFISNFKVWQTQGSILFHHFRLIKTAMATALQQANEGAKVSMQKITGDSNDYWYF
jgi:hypothetical protein